MQGMPGDLQQPQQGQRQANRQHDERNPARNRQILGFDANAIELVDIAGGADQQNDAIGAAAQHCGQTHRAAQSMRQLAHHHVNANMGADLDAVGHAKQHQPGEQISGQFQRPAKTGAKDIASDHLTEGDEGHQHQQQGNEALLQMMNNADQHAGLSERKRGQPPHTSAWGD